MEKKLEKMTKVELLNLLNHKEEVLQEKIQALKDLEEKKLEAEELLKKENTLRNHAEQEVVEQEQINEVLHETINIKESKIRKYKRERIVYLVAIIVLLGVVGYIL